MSARSIIVTGGFGALGSVVASAFAAQGDRVARVDFAKQGPDRPEGALDIGGVDLTDSKAAEKAVKRITEAFGGVDSVVNIAGGFIWDAIGDGSLASWERMFAMNLMTTATMNKAALPALLARPGARIVNIGALVAMKAGMGTGPYAASKAAVHRLTESLAEELASKDITVNAILPSIIDTPTNRADMPDADFSQWVTAQAVADVILFLTSHAGRSINGALIPVTRGA